MPGRGELFAVLAALLWGINYPVVKLVLQSVPENDFLIIRFVLAVFLFAPYLAVRGETLSVRREDIGRLLILGCLGVGAYNILWTYGIHKTTAANAALLISSSPVLAGIYSAATGGEKMRPVGWLGMLMAFAGIYLIVSGVPGAAGAAGSDVLLGNTLVLAGAFLFALYAVLAKPLLEHYSSAKLTALAMTAGLPVIILYSLATGRPLAALTSVPLAVWAALTYVVVAGTVLAFIFWYEGIKHTSPLKTILFHFIVPVVSMIAGAAMLSEQITAERIAGGLLVFCGLLVTKGLAGKLAPAVSRLRTKLSVKPPARR